MNTPSISGRLSAASALLALAALLLPLSSSHAFPLPGTTPLGPGQTVAPGQVASGSNPGTGPLATTSVSNFDGGNSVFRTAVFREGSGTVDFYFQLSNSNAAAGAVFMSLFNNNFAAYATSVGYRLDGGTLSGVGFSNGTIIPLTANRSASGSMVGFDFTGLVAGVSSVVFIISTNATNFQFSNSYTLTGALAGSFGTDGVAPTPVTYNNLLGVIPIGPGAPVGAPEGGTSVLLLGLGLSGLWVAQRAFVAVRKAT
ncbi:MAG: hypothetical protein ACJ74Y_16515 [Bryobacteraceae bacterium]